MYARPLEKLAVRDHFIEFRAVNKEILAAIYFGGTWTTSGVGDRIAKIVYNIQHAPDELSQYSSFDYVIINDEIERAVAQLASIIYAERARCVRQEGLVRRVMEEFRSAEAKHSTNRQS